MPSENIRKNNFFDNFRVTKEKYGPPKKCFNTIKLHTFKKIIDRSYAFLELKRGNALLFLYPGKCFGPIAVFSSF